MNTIRKSYGKAIQKVAAVITLLCLLLSLGAVTASAADTAKITVSSCTVERGTTASVTFNLQDNPGMYALILKVKYDASVMTLESVSNGCVFPDSEVLYSSLTTNPFTYSGYASGINNVNTSGALVTLHFEVNENAAFGTYSVTVESATGFNDSYEKFDIASANGSISVAACAHANKEWKIITPAKCEEAGKETLVCKKCGTTFETRAIKATGHQHTEIRNAVAATKTAEGYAGDTYCADCGKLISKGKTIAKLNSDTSSADDALKMTSGNDLTFVKNSNDPLVFVSNADFSEFIRVEIDGNALNEGDFTAESGSTIITVSADFLNKLSNGDHTISIVSTSGTASAEFAVQNVADTSDAEKAEPAENDSVETNSKASATPVIIVIIVVLLAGGAVAFFVIWRRRYL